MASVFTYDHDPPRISSPWSTSGASTPRLAAAGIQDPSSLALDCNDPGFLTDCGVTKLDAEPQDGPTEYKLHLLLRPRRSFVSMSTGNVLSGSARSASSPALPRHGQNTSDTALRPPQSPSGHSRQKRLQQLTTQLLWRLQQSSPFHSSSRANLVLPILPEATPTLNVPQTPSRLLPGLEESQGALYEIGVLDDGTFVGLIEDELEESLTNLRAMAASLGCMVEVLRKVAVGDCEWAEQASDGKGIPRIHSEKLWVAEALVSPDLIRHVPQSPDPTGYDATNSHGQETTMRAETTETGSPPTEQLHVAIAGPTAAGKSSLLGTLSTSAFDNGRGKSRLSLLKHHHEIASGVTSSIAQELIGYTSVKNHVTTRSVEVVNYASGNVTAWNDIHAAAEGGRLTFLSDLPGSMRYIKSTLRGLVSWKPHYVMLCVPANCAEEPDCAELTPELDLSVSFLGLCVKLELPVLVVVTKLDLATRAGLRQTLTRVLSAIKSVGRKPVILPAPVETANQDMDLQKINFTDIQDAGIAVTAVGRDGVAGVPIVLTSAVTGAGVGKLHALLRLLPIPSEDPPTLAASSETQPEAIKVFDINEVFEMPSLKVYTPSSEHEQGNKGVILCGRVRRGQVSVGDRLVVGPIPRESRAENESALFALRARSLYSRSLPEGMASAHLHRLHPDRPQAQHCLNAHWQEVSVVSVRNLRLPVKTLHDHQIGTVGIEPVAPMQRIGRIRKGMVLADFRHSPSSIPIPSLLLSSFFHIGFIAAFPARDFTSTLSSSLILGGSAIVYIANVRAAARVACLAPPKNEESKSQTPSPTEPDIFSFDHVNDGSRPLDDGTWDSEGQDTDSGGDTDISNVEEDDDVKITFSFISSVAWIDIGSRVFVLPGTTVATSSSSLRGAMGPMGLNGLVGRVSQVIGG